MIPIIHISHEYIEDIDSCSIIDNSWIEWKESPSFDYLLGYYMGRFEDAWNELAKR